MLYIIIRYQQLRIIRYLFSFYILFWFGWSSKYLYGLGIKQINLLFIFHISCDRLFSFILLFIWFLYSIFCSFTSSLTLYLLWYIHYLFIINVKNSFFIILGRLAIKKHIFELNWNAKYVVFFYVVIYPIYLFSFFLFDTFCALLF